jgi:hypothetical protein
MDSIAANADRQAAPLKNLKNFIAIVRLSITMESEWVGVDSYSQQSYLIRA